MTSEELRKRSAALADATTEKALEAHRAVLADDPAQAPAAIRLGRALTELERFDEAEAMFRAVLEHDPKNRIARDRLAGMPRRRTAPKPATATARRSVRSAGPRCWLKGVHYANDGWTIAPGETTWISDIGRRNEDGTRKFTVDGTPYGRPSWAVGDEVSLYFSGTLKIPVLVEVISPPEFNPQFVADRDGSEEAGERWPWVTCVRGLRSKPLDDAPTLTELGLSPQQVQRLSRATVDADQHARIVAALGA